MLRKIVAVVAVTALAAAPAAAEVAWQTYHNERFGYSVDVPTSYLIVQPAPANADGRSYVGADGRVYLAAWGAYNTLAWSLDEYYHAALARPGLGTVTYRRKTDTWYVLSGYRTVDGSAGPYEAIFYDRLHISANGGAISGISMVFAPSLRDELDPIVTRISRSLTAPR